MNSLPTALNDRFLLALFVPLVASCGAFGGAGAEPCPLPITVEASPGTRLNPDEAGTPLPTTIRIMQLKSVAKLREADFEAMTTDAATALGEELIGSQELTLFPNEPARLPIELDPEARFLVAVAVVRRPAGTMWRSVIMLPSAEDRCDDFLEDGAPDPAIIFRVQDYRISGTSHLGSSSDSTVLPSDVAD